MMLSVDGLRLQRGGLKVLDIDHLDVRRGEILGIVGPNGSGKSSLLLAIGLLAPASFRTYGFDGRPAIFPSDVLSLRRQMAMVFQEPLLLDTSVLANVAGGQLLRGVPRREATTKAEMWLERLGVAHLSRRPARALSGGEAQRVSLARALSLAPKLLLLDEPFAALDVLTRSPLLAELRPLLQDAGSTAILVTHDIAEIGHLADRVAVLEGGRICQCGTPPEVFAAPASSTVQRMASMAADTVAALQPFIRT